jgi:hypothetical protein
MVALQQSPVALHSEPSRIRLIDEVDVNPWMLGLAQRRYSNRFDFQAGELWVKGIVLRQPMVFLPIRTDNAFCIGMISANPWLPAEWHAHIAMVAAEEGKMWDAMALLRESVEWAKRRKCVDWRMNSQTSFDLAPMARRLGAVEDPGCWKVDL